MSTLQEHGERPLAAPPFKHLMDETMRQDAASACLDRCGSRPCVQRRYMVPLAGPGLALTAHQSMALVPYVSLRRLCFTCSGPAIYFCSLCTSASYCSRHHFELVRRPEDILHMTNGAQDWPNHRQQCADFLQDITRAWGRLLPAPHKPDGAPFLSDTFETTEVRRAIHFSASTGERSTINIFCYVWSMPIAAADSLPTRRVELVLLNCFPTARSIMELAHVLVTQGRGGTFLSQPLHVWYRPNAGTPNVAVQRVIPRSVQCGWAGDIVVLKYGSPALGSYVDADSYDVSHLVYFFSCYPSVVAGEPTRQ